MAKSFIEASIVAWHPSDNPEDTYPGHERIQLGCLQRIANSMENMERPFKKLIDDAQMYERWYRQELATNKKLQKRVAAYQGIINSMKRKQKESQL